MFKNIIFILALIISVILLLSKGGNSLVTTTYNNVKIESKHQQELIGKKNGSDISTEIRYLIITDKGTFICESNFWKGKFNNSDIFWHIKEDSTYSSITVTGWGKGFFFDYQNLISIK